MSLSLEQLTSFAKRRGFVYPGSEIYGGFAGTWDYGPLGLALKNNLRASWWRRFVSEREEVYGLESAILMPARVWEASGHLANFADPLPDTARQFNLMFETKIGALADSAATAYLRPETAQGMFTNFKNIIDSFHPKLPFGLAQSGKCFRNEITPRDFLFRVREFEIMEIEYFVPPEDWENHFEAWRAITLKWFGDLGLTNCVHELEVAQEDRAHYSSRTIDFEFDFPFGRKELAGLAYRSDFDLKQHTNFSGVDLTYYDAETKMRFLPHVIEPTFGLDRLVLAVLATSYTEDEMDGEKRTVLKLPNDLAPVKVAVFPLLKNKPELVNKARIFFNQLKAGHNLKVFFDDNGNIGKRYRRQDEIGTPYCVTIDFQTLEDETVTLRERDSGKQERVAVANLSKALKFSTIEK